MPRIVSERVWFLCYKCQKVNIDTRKHYEEMAAQDSCFSEPFSPRKYKRKGNKLAIPNYEKSIFEWWPIVDLVEQRKLNAMFERGYREGLKARSKDAVNDS